MCTISPPNRRVERFAVNEVYPRLRVFVSSRMDELAPERQAIRATLDDLLVHAWVYENDQGASPKSIRDSYLEEVEAADLYIGIFWHSLGDATAEEYEHARKHGKDCLIYEKHFDLSHRDPQLQSFLDRLSDLDGGHTPRRFETAEKLGEFAKEDLASWQTRKIRERLPARPAVSPTVAEVRQRRDLLVLLSKVKRDWVEGILKRSASCDTLINLGIEQLPLGEQLRYERVVEFPGRSSRAVPQSQPLTELLDEAERSLLILGAPGSGKTTTLLQLASDLIELAERDQLMPIPVVLNLSSWSDGNESVLRWLIEELASKYQVPRAMGRSWLSERWLLPMLDGLDEVEAGQRTACVRAINDYVGEHGVPGLVVSCRLHEYTSLPDQLKTGGAVCLRPLTTEQVLEHLESGGTALRELTAAIQHDPQLMTLAETPLMLSIMIAVYHNAEAERLPHHRPGSLETRRTQVFQHYVDEMLSRQLPNRPEDGRPDIVVWLSWLARAMERHSRSVFLVEELRPSWLDGPLQRLSHATLVSLIAGAVFFLILGLPSDFIDYGFEDLSGVEFGLLVSSCVLVGGWSRSTVKNGLFIALFIISISMLVRANGGSEDLFTAIISAGMFGGIISLVGVGPFERVTPAEVVEWDWNRIRMNAIRAGGIWGATAGVIGATWMGVLITTDWDVDRWELVQVVVVSGSLIGLAVGSLAGLVTGLVKGLEVTSKLGKTAPNEGIKLSGRNAAVVFRNSVLIGLPMLLALLGLVSGLFYILDGEAGIDPEAIVFGLLTVLLFSAIVALNRGGSAVIKHYSLRFILGLGRDSRFKIVELLDRCSQLALLKKVGGGYVFVHRMLLDYFAGSPTRPSGGSR